eukprot:SAG11_NODE_5979_length_1420_cov_1.020439_2_plen_90_part_00
MVKTAVSSPTGYGEKVVLAPCVVVVYRPIRHAEISNSSSAVRGVRNAAQPWQDGRKEKIEVALDEESKASERTVAPDVVHPRLNGSLAA